MLFGSRFGLTLGTNETLREVLYPIALVPPVSGNYNTGERTTLGFTLIGPALNSLPYLFLALKDLGQTGLGRDYLIGAGKFDLEQAESIAPQCRKLIYSGSALQSKITSFSYADLLHQAEEWDGTIALRFPLPTSIGDGNSCSLRPAFSTMLSKLILRANALASFYGSGILYGLKESLEILEEVKKVKLTSAIVNEIYYNCRIDIYNRPNNPPSSFIGELIYKGYFSKDTMALLSLGEIINVGKMAAFGSGMFRMERRP